MSLRTLPIRPGPTAGAAPRPRVASGSELVNFPSGVRIASLGSAEIRIHPIWLVGVPVLGVLLTLGRAGIEAQLAMGLQPLAWALSALIHEGAHAVVAKHIGLHVRLIALRPFGGMTAYEGHAVSDREQLWISSAGPIASLVLAMLAIGVSASLTGPLGHALRFLACFNGAVFAFNALPALPLDGGRVARAVLSLRGQTERGTHRALDRLRVASGYSLGAIGGGLIVLAPLSLLTTAAGSLVLLWTGWMLVASDRWDHSGRREHPADGTASLRTARVSTRTVSDDSVPAPYT